MSTGFEPAVYYSLKLDDQVNVIGVKSNCAGLSARLKSRALLDILPYLYPIRNLGRISRNNKSNSCSAARRPGHCLAPCPNGVKVNCFLLL